MISAKSSQWSSVARLAAMASLVALIQLDAPVHAEEIKSHDRLERVGFDALPGYIKAQINGIVLHCTSGALTPNKATIYAFTAAADPERTHYAIDFLAWKDEPASATCSTGSAPCDSGSCQMLAYTQTDKDLWIKSQKLYVDALSLVDGEGDDTGTSFIEVHQEKSLCRFARTSGAGCTVHFTWANGKLKYFGFGEEKAAEPFQVDGVTGHLIPPGDATPTPTDAK